MYMAMLPKITTQNQLRLLKQEKRLKKDPTFCKEGLSDQHLASRGLAVDSLLQRPCSASARPWRT